MGCFGYICKDCGEAIRGDCWVGGEDCILIHVRHGQEIGRVQGHYNEYGGVIEEANMDENKKFRGSGEDNPNSHKCICDSEMHMDDSFYKLSQLKEYNGDWVDFREFYKKIWNKDLKKYEYNMYDLPYIDIIINEAVSNRKFSDNLNTYNAIYKKFVHLDIEEEDMNISIFHMKDLANTIFEELVWTFYDIKDKYFRKEFDKLPDISLSDYSGIVAYHSLCYRRAKRKGTFNLVPSYNDPNQSWGKPRKKYK